MQVSDQLNCVFVARDRLNGADALEYACLLRVQSYLCQTQSRVRALACGLDLSPRVIECGDGYIGDQRQVILRAVHTACGVPPLRPCPFDEILRKTCASDLGIGPSRQGKATCIRRYKQIVDLPTKCPHLRLDLRSHAPDERNGNPMNHMHHQPRAD